MQYDLPFLKILKFVHAQFDWGTVGQKTLQKFNPPKNKVIRVFIISEFRTVLKFLAVSSLKTKNTLYIPSVLMK